MPSEVAKPTPPSMWTLCRWRVTPNAWLLAGMPSGIVIVEAPSTGSVASWLPGLTRISRPSTGTGGSSRSVHTSTAPSPGVPGPVDSSVRLNAVLPTVGRPPRFGAAAQR
jgi:hypothetical protein